MALNPLGDHYPLDCPMHLIEWEVGAVARCWNVMNASFADHFTKQGLGQIPVDLNEINTILHAPFMGAGLCFEEGGE